MAKTAWLVAGGTGGHVFPAQAVAEGLLARGWRVRLVTDARGVRFWPEDMGIDTDILPAGSIFTGSPLARVRALGRIVQNLWHLHRRLRQKRPDVVMGFGGYPVFAAGVVAAWAGVPLILHEQNAVLGRANRVLARIASRLALSFADTRHVPAHARHKTVVTGNPVRAAFQTAGFAPYQAPAPSDPIRLVVLGGSLGARVFGDLLPEALGLLPEQLRQRLVLTQQCRAEDLAAVTARYQTLGIPCTLAPFLTDVPRHLAEAHLVMARAGASTIAELVAVGRPALLVPYPSAMDDHQTANAQQLVNRGAAWMVQERELTEAVLAAQLQDLLESPHILAKAAAAAHTAAVSASSAPNAPLNATDALADLAHSMIS